MAKMKPESSECRQECCETGILIRHFSFGSSCVVVYEYEVICYSSDLQTVSLKVFLIGLLMKIVFSAA